MDKLDYELGCSRGAEMIALPGREGVEDNIIVLGYEYGAVCKDYIYSKVSDDTDIVRARAANSITELQDIVCQALLIFAKLKERTNSMKNMTVADFILDGLERQQFRMTEIMNKKINYSAGVEGADDGSK